jgi:glyoxylase-like metal-dependent hydrolase (beta-lactamase superfamily II)
MPVKGFFEDRTSSIQYVVADPSTSACAILDFDEKSGAIGTRSANQLLGHIASSGFKVAWILDTHPHADHMSAAAYLARCVRHERASSEKSSPHRCAMLAASTSLRSVTS